jgi:hypothetical protein
MSFDLGVWYSDVPLTRPQAAEFYRHINTDWVVVRRQPEFDAFLGELLSRFPSFPSVNDVDQPPSAMLETMDEVKTPPTAEQPSAWRQQPAPPDDSPWAATLGPRGSAVTLPITGSGLAVVEVVYALAARHGLIVYNPQSGQVTLPATLHGPSANSSGVPLLTLRIAGEPHALRMKISIDDRILVDTVLTSRLEAHSQARSLALQNGLALYQVDDPKCLMHAMKWVPVSADDLDLPAALKKLLGPGVQIRRLSLPDANPDSAQ